MGIFELLATAIALSMDAFAVAICKGLSACKVRPKHMIVTGLWFGGFQALMPLIGYFLGTTFERYITPVDHWIAFLLLGLLGANMIKESFDKEEACTDASLAVRVMLTMAIATSIDALAVGITFALLPDVKIWLAVGLIGVITFIMSAVGIKAGSVFGAKNKRYAELFGGIVLILIGTKILLEHLGVIAF
ncbi:MAG: manganese efflux pump [Clostridia bacterium]|nr:manganese efflux pump [Clostridia bacterium]